MRPHEGQDPRRQEEVAAVATPASSSGNRLAVALLAGAGVAAALGVYGQAHPPASRPVFTLGFSSVLPMKAWLTTVAASLLVVQLLTALWMWGRLPGAGQAPAWAGILHRWSGTTAFVITLPVALHCLWSLGFATGSARVVVHGLAGCVFYGAYATKMLSLRLGGVARRGVPGAGGAGLGAAR